VTLLLLACFGDPAQDTEPSPTSVDTDCSSCEALGARQRVLAEACGLGDVVEPRPCSAANYIRLDCQVTCMEAADCELMDGSNISYSSDSWRTYRECSESCIGI